MFINYYFVFLHELWSFANRKLFFRKSNKFIIMNTDKNQIIGFVLMGLVLMGFFFYNSKQQAEQMEYQRVNDSIQQVEMDKAAKAEQKLKIQEEKKLEAQKSDTLNALFAARQGAAGTTTIENELLTVVISNQGGQIESVTLKDDTYKNQNGGNVCLFDKGDSEMKLLIDGKEDNINTAEFFFNPTNKKKDGVTMALPVQNGSLEISYSLKPNSYLLSMDVQAKNIAGFFSSKTNTFELVWTEKMKQQEKGWDFENRYSTVTYRTTDNDTEELSSMGGDEEKNADDFKESIKWITFKTQFFSQVLIADKSLKVNNMSSVKNEKGSGYLKTLSTSMTSDFDIEGKKSSSFNFYLGPNKFSTLTENEEMLQSDSKLNLRSLVYLGWPIVRWINRYFIIYLFDWLTGWGLNMGVVLLLLTILIKMLVFPLMKKSHLSSARMRVLKPKIEELSKKYPKPEDAMLKQQETMKLYSEYGVSPAGGCLPMLIQMPIWIALFNFIPNAIEFRGQSFLWANDLSTYDDVINWGTNIWGIGDHLSLFCILWCASTVITQFFTMRQQQDTMSPEQAQQMKMMQWMMYLMPLIFFFSFNSYSSGLNYYYFISSIISVGLMWFLRKTTDDAKLLAQLEERHKIRKQQVASGKRPTSMMERMQAMQQKQMEILKQQQEAQRQRELNEKK